MRNKNKFENVDINNNHSFLGTNENQRILDSNEELQMKAQIRLINNEFNGEDEDEEENNEEEEEEDN